MRTMVLSVLLLLSAGAVGVAGLSFAAERLQELVSDAFMTNDVDKVPPADVAMVLGTAPVLPPANRANPDFLARLDAAAAVWKAGKVKYILASGNGRGPGIWDETTMMRRGLIERGVPATAIYRDDRGMRTWDSVVRARDIFGQKRLIIVSQRSHVARALFLAHSLGMDVYGFEADDRLVPPDLHGRLRHFPAAVLSYFDAWRGKLPRMRGTAVVIGVDPPS